MIAIGPGKINNEGKLIPLNIKVGDKVLFTQYAPNEIKIEEKNIWLLRKMMF